MFITRQDGRKSTEKVLLSLIHSQRYLFDLDGYQIRNPPAGLENVDPQTAELAYAAQKDALAWAIEVAEEGETPSTSGYSTHSGTSIIH